LQAPTRKVSAAINAKSLRCIGTILRMCGGLARFLELKARQ
jgi:hypothetical protein